MFGFGGVEFIFLAVAASIVIRASSRAAEEIGRTRRTRQEKSTNGGSQERIEALEERLRRLEERQDFTDDLLSSRHEPRLEAPDDPRPDPDDDGGSTPGS